MDKSPNKHSNPKVELGKRIREAIKKSGLSQAEVARRISASPSNLNKWIRGEVAPGFENIVKFSKETKSSIDYLLTGQGQVTQKVTTENICTDKAVGQRLKWALEFKSPETENLEFKFIESRDLIRLSIGNYLENPWFEEDKWNFEDFLSELSYNLEHFEKGEEFEDFGFEEGIEKYQSSWSFNSLKKYAIILGIQERWLFRGEGKPEDPHRLVYRDSLLLHFSWSKVSDRIRETRIENGLSIKELGDKAFPWGEKHSIGEKLVYNMDALALAGNDEYLSYDALLKIAIALNCNIDWLLSGAGRKEHTTLSDRYIFFHNNADSLDGDNSNDDSYYEPETRLAFRMDWAQAKGDLGDILWYDIQDDAMSTSFEIGDRLLYKRSNKDYPILIGGGLYIIGLMPEMHSYQGIVRRLQPLPNGKLKIIADNPKYENLEADRDEINIYGKVISYWRDLE